MIFKIDPLSYRDIKKKVESIRSKNTRLQSVPVPIEEYIEFDLELDIIPLPGFRDRFDIDGFLTLDRTAIYISQELMDKYYNRYRFTLAHEIGHYALHGNLFDFFRGKLSESKSSEYTENWKSFVLKFNINEYSKLEGQAYDFAGILLVPDDELSVALAKAKEMILNSKLDMRKVNREIIQGYVNTYLSKRFEVSVDVIGKRIQKEELKYF